MKTTILKEHAEFFGKKLQNDLRSVVDGDQVLVGNIEAWLSEKQKFENLNDPDSWIDLSRRTGRPIDDLQSILAPIVVVAKTCAEENVDVGDLADDLQEADVLPKEGATEKRKDNLVRMAKPLEKLLRKEDVQTSPDVPLLYISSIHTRCLFVSEFDKEFGPNTDIGEYTPSLVRLHPRITLQIRFKDEAQEPIGILLNPQSLALLKRWLAFAEKQMGIASNMVSKDFVAVNPE